MNLIARLAILATLALHADLRAVAGSRRRRRRRSRPIRGRATSICPTRRCSSTSRRSTSGTATGSTSAAALAIKPTGAKDETFGVVFATARTQVDKVARTVVFENLKITKTDFPTLPNHGAAYTRRAAEGIREASVRTISLDRLEASLALAGVKPPTVAVQQHAAAGDRQLFAGDPGADRRRAGAEARARATRASSASSTRAR